MKWNYQFDVDIGILVYKRQRGVSILGMDETLNLCMCSWGKRCRGCTISIDIGAKWEYVYHIQDNQRWPETLSFLCIG